MNMNVFVRCFIQDKEKIKNYGKREMFKVKEKDATKWIYIWRGMKNKLKNKRYSV